MDKISVIIPVYNVEKYLDRCIESVVNQTYKNLEIILVDDGSPENCPQICDEWTKKDDRIIVVHKKNGGLSDARNKGIDIASGTYICFVDSDDYISENMIEKLYNVLTEANAEISICNFRYVDESGNDCTDKKLFSNDNLPITDNVLSSFDILADKMFEPKNWYWVVAWNKLYKKELFDDIRYPVGKIHEDEYVIHKILIKCHNVACVSDMLYYYVQRNDSIMKSTKTNPRRIDYIEAYLLRAKLYAENEKLKHKAKSLMILAINDYYTCLTNKIFDTKKNKYIQHLFREVYNKAEKECNRSDLKTELKLFLNYISIVKSWKLLNVKKVKLIKVIRLRLSLLKKIAILYKKINLWKKNNSNGSILIDTPTHGNLGDHAIALAQIQLLKSQNINYLEITANEIDGIEKACSEFLPKKYNVLIHGGGFLGNLWPVEEYRFRNIIKAFSKNKIIVFPQTVTFDLVTEEGRTFFEESKKLYSGHNNLTLFVREKKSFDFMKQYMPDVSTYLVPDIVTLLKVPLKQHERCGILLCMRQDVEKNLSDSDMAKIENTLKVMCPNEKIEFVDTVMPYGISPESREKEVFDMLNTMSKAKLVITDRLHGMVFSALTETPCIAFGNINGKVKGVYEWIKENQYIKYVENVDEFENDLSALDLNKPYRYNYDNIIDKFDSLFESIK